MTGETIDWLLADDYSYVLPTRMVVLFRILFL